MHITTRQVRNRFNLFHVEAQTCQQITFNVPSGFLFVSVTSSLTLFSLRMFLSRFLFVSEQVDVSSAFKCDEESADLKDAQ